MSRDRVPEDDALLRPELLEQAVDDRPGGFAPAVQSAAAGAAVGRAPAGQVALAGKGDSGPAHPLVAGSLSHRQDICFRARQQVMAQVGEADRRGIGYVVGSAVGKGIEAGTDTRRSQVFQKGLDLSALVRMRQW